MLTRRQMLVGIAGMAGLAAMGCTGSGKAKYRIAVIPKGLTHEHWQSVHRGAERAAGDLTGQGLSTEILWDGPKDESGANEQIDLINQKVGLGINGLVLAPQDSKQMVSPVEQAVERGIPVVIIDSNLDEATLKRRPELVTKYVATDNYNGGKLAADHLLGTLKQLNVKAPRLILFRYQPGSESTEQREKGFIDVVEAEMARRKKASEPPITWVERDNIYAGAKVDTAMQKASEQILPLVLKGVDGIFAVNESATDGLVKVLRRDPNLPKVQVMGFDASEPLLQAIRNGEIIGSIVQDPYRMGYLGVWHVVQHLEGYDVKPGGAMTLSTGEYLLTRENLDSQASRERFIADQQTQRSIETPTYAKR